MTTITTTHSTSALFGPITPPCLPIVQSNYSHKQGTGRLTLCFPHPKAGYKTHTIKESIRVGYGDLGDFYRATGAFQDAIKAYARTRDYCTTARHVVSTCLDIARVGVEAENYQHVQNYCAKAAAAVGSGGGGVAGDSATGGGGTPSVASASHCAEPFALAELARAAGLAALEQRKVSNRAFPKSKACLFYL